MEILVYGVDPELEFIIFFALNVFCENLLKVSFVLVPTSLQNFHCFYAWDS